MSILGLATVIGRGISTHYPDFGLQKYKILFNNTVPPRIPCQKPNPEINILFCRHGHYDKTVIFQPNHFAPLAHKANSNSKKRNLIQSKLINFPKLKNTNHLLLY